MKVENIDILEIAKNDTNIIGHCEIKNKIYGFSVVDFGTFDLFSFSPEIRVGRKNVELQIRKVILERLEKCEPVGD
mgnify:CR=1 FL=1